MPETEPKYFTDLKKIILDFFGRTNERFTSIDNQLKDIRHDIRDVNSRLDGHADQIAEMATDIITIKHLIHRKADKEDVNDLTKQVTILEQAHGA